MGGCAMDEDDEAAALAHQEELDAEYYAVTCLACRMFWAVSDSELCGSCGGELNIRRDYGRD